jgi:hypothetical protein
MKMNYKLGVAALLAFFIYTNESKAVKITFGTKCHPDGQGSCVGERGICLIIEIKANSALARYPDPGVVLGDDMAYGEIGLIGQDRIRLDVLAHHSDVKVDEHFTLEEPVQLSDELCHALGCRSATLQPGVYDVDYSAHRLGTILMDVVIQ